MFRFTGGIKKYQRSKRPSIPTHFMKRKRYRRFGGYAGTKGKGKIAGQYIPGRSRGYLRRGGFYGRYAKGSEELKFLDTSVDDAIVSSSGDIQTSGTVNVIPQGVTESERVGRKCTIKKILWRYTVSLPEYDAQATPENSDIVRIIMYVDKQCNGATATVGDVITSTDYQAFNNLANSGRFRIIHENVVVINYSTLASDNSGVVSGSSHRKHFKMFKNCNIPIEYDSSASTGAIGTIRTNNIGVLLISKSGVAGFDSVVRLRFSDGS